MNQRLVQSSNDSVKFVSNKFIRPIFHAIPWDNNLTALLGARGVGKTTLLLQRMRQLDLPTAKSMYIDLGDLYFQENRLIDFIVDYVAAGGQYLFIDEVHRYGYDTWAQELKQAYDLYRGRLTITFTGSSAIRILKQKADLSRRALQVRIPGLSFREYLILKEDVELPIFSYRDILANHREITRKLLLERPDFTPLAYLPAYWQKGYFPFFLEQDIGYYNRLNTIVQLVLESDIPNVMESGRTDYQKLSRLLFAIASSVPFKPNISKLAERMQLSRDSVYTYLELLDRAHLTIGIRSEAKGIAAIGKPDKIYLHNPNQLYTLAPNQVNLGTVRETFFVNQLHTLTYESHILPPEIRLPKKGDFVLLDKNDRYLFEVGGAKKTSQQIGREPNNYVIADTEQTNADHIVPLWLFGLLY